MNVIDLNYGENYKQEIDLKSLLEKKIAGKLNVPKNQVILNYGSNSNILLLFSSFSVYTLLKKRRKLKVLYDYPNYFFSLRQFSEWYIKSIIIQRDKYFNLPISRFIKEIRDKKPDMVLVTTPNNPTGKPINDSELEKIIRSTPKDCVIIIDRSCVNVLPEIPSKKILQKYRDKKIVIIHSFSKSHSLSDERVGFLVSNDRLITDFLRPKTDLNHNLHALVSLEKRIDDNSILEEKRFIIKECNKLLYDFFSNSKLSEYYSSNSNFALIKLPPKINSKFAVEFMNDHDILIMGGHNLGMGHDYIRVHMSGIRKIKKFISVYKLLEGIKL